ncbi:MAG: XrtA/PEP-CTERM system histidine kinase PrsK [Alphaproteobacteria bacterium]
MLIGLVSHGLGFSAILVLLVLLILGWQRNELGRWIVGATAATLAWEALEVANVRAGDGLRLTAGLLEIARSGAWIGLVIVILGRMGLEGSRRAMVRALAVAAVLVAAATLTHDVALAARWTSIALGRAAAAGTLGHLALAVIGLALIENLYRPLDDLGRWRVKFFCFALGGLFAYDLFAYAHVLLFRSFDPELFAARGLVTAMMTPLLAVSVARNREWRVDIGVSRATVFHTAALFGTGAYLIVMSAAGYYIKEFGGSWGAVLRIAFLVGVVLVLAVVLSSARLRSRLRVFLSKHFFSYKYDYRLIWLGFIETLAKAELGARLENRVIRAVADVTDSPDGALWLGDGEGVFRLAARWNTDTWGLPAEHDLIERSSSPLIDFMARRGIVVIVDEVLDQQEYYDRLALPGWLSGASRAWIVLPLPLGARLVGFLVLGKPRAPRTLDWEDFDILRTVGRQVASYLAEQSAARALADAREFEAFSRRFAFVVHDVKNLTSQLSLLAGNAEKFGHDADFRHDMVATMREATDKLTRLLARMRETDETEQRALPLGAFLRSVMQRWDGVATGLRLEVDVDHEPTMALDVERFRTALNHLIQNAIEATGKSGASITVRLASRGNFAVIEVVDQGPGMTPDFVRDQLFRPFQTTKSGGYGIGVFESRTLVHEMGGELEVVTAPGEGTTMRILLPTPSAGATAVPSSAA